MNTLCIAGACVQLDRDTAYEILVALSNLHGCQCRDIAATTEMSDANKLASNLPAITEAYNAVESIAARFDEREPEYV